MVYDRYLRYLWILCLKFFFQYVLFVSDGSDNVVIHDGLVMFEDNSGFSFRNLIGRKRESKIDPHEHAFGFMAMLPNWTQYLEAGMTVCNLIQHISGVEQRYLFVHTLGLGDRDRGKRIQIEKQIDQVLTMKTDHIQYRMVSLL